MVAALGTALALSTASCGGSDEESKPDPVAVDLSEFEKAPVPDNLWPIVREDMPEEGQPAMSAPLHEEMAWNAMYRITDIGGRVDESAHGKCPEFEREKGASATCEVRYLDHDFKARITLTEVREYTLNYRVEVDALPVTREKALHELRMSTLAEYAACDMDDVEIVDPGNPDDKINCRAFGTRNDLLHRVTLKPTQRGPYEYPGEVGSATPIGEPSSSSTP
ncbi:hypothetical protein ACFQZ2_10170 [Streptomonospora algeriensis]|uniref:Lipoprotein n=1 Tax=Streptomonospora algeriensis TaxID=995084 RepID=A0ABW3BDJ0_9ACTN